MHTWTKMLLALLLIVTTGCADVPQAPPPLSADQRHAKYSQLQDQLPGIPYVLSWELDSRQDKLAIAVGTLEARRAVAKAVSDLGLPPDAVIIHEPIPVLSEAAPFAGCQPTAQQPPGEDAGLRLTPKEMRPGQPFQLMVEAGGEIMRGVDSYLECWDGTGWSTRYMLSVGVGAPDAEPTAHIYTAGTAVITLGLIGSGPEALVLPANMPPGWYRIRKQVSVGTKQETFTRVFQVR